MDRNIRTSRFFSSPYQLGKVSFILLLVSCRASKSLQLIKDCGTGPSSWLLLIFKLFNKQPSRNNPDILTNLFSSRLKCRRERLKFPKQSGILPPKLFSYKKISLKKLKLHIDEGISPFKILDPAEKPSNEGGKVGIGPWNKFEQRLGDYWIFFHRICHL